MRELVIGLEHWVLQDGNYTDFAVGDRRQFAVEFYYDRTHRLETVEAGPRPTVALRGSTFDYDAVAQVTVSRPHPDVGPGVFVLDCGDLWAYSETLLLDDVLSPREGTWLRGRISLFVDHFAYMDELGTLPDMPPLICTWDVLAIEERRTTLIQVPSGHPLYSGPECEGPAWVSDPSREHWQPVERTTTWLPEGQTAAGYRLRCQLLDEEPEHTMRRSGARSPYGPLTTGG